jgi:hypothetical protein
MRFEGFKVVKINVWTSCSPVSLPTFQRNTLLQMLVPNTQTIQCHNLENHNVYRVYNFGVKFKGMDFLPSLMKTGELVQNL